MVECVQAIQFGLMDSDEIKRLSVVHVTNHDMYDKGIPKSNGLSDLRMGTIDRQYICRTCNQNALNCPGHFGHIELATPVYHILYLKQLVKLLQSICFNCYKPLVNIKEIYKSNSVQFKYSTDLCKNKLKCAFCDETKSKFVCEKYEFFNGGKKVSNSHLYNIICKMENLHLFGFNTIHSHPKNFFITNLIVPPPHVRPSITMDASLRSQDDLTHKLTEIIKINNILLKENSPQQMYDLLQYHITTYIDNGIPGIAQATQRTGRPLKAICQRLKTKEGRIRGNLMGKRVNFSARTVITAEPNIDLDELGVPWQISQNLTYPETVTNFNKDILDQYVKNGPNPPHLQVGAKFVIQDSIIKDLRFIKNIDLKIGDTVERHLKDGDIVIFNRQPSLHKMSMMGHKIKIMDNSTFRMNLSATKPYNADFDGDEMNIFVPQNSITKAEISELMMVSSNIVSPQSNKPVMGVLQDSLLGSYILSFKDSFVNKCLLHDIATYLKIDISKIPPPFLIKPKHLWSGKQLIQMILPPDFNYKRKSPDGDLLILNGHIISGNLCKKSLGTSECSIIHCLWLDYGPDVAKTFLSEIQYIITLWLQQHSFSIGIMDIITSKSVDTKVKTIIDDTICKIDNIINLAKHSSFDVSIYETKINHSLNNAMSLAGRAVQYDLIKNNIDHTVTSGSKGSIINISQIMACVGQQNVNGQRISMGYDNRVLPHFLPNDIRPAAKGFVSQSYKKGLKPHEFFYHAMGGREGIIDTAVKTSETGYIQRRLVKSMEDLRIDFDLSVRNSVGDIIQFKYGDDGFDATYLTTETFNFTTSGLQNYTKLEISKIYPLLYSIPFQYTFRTPVNITRLLMNYGKYSKIYEYSEDTFNEIMETFFSKTSDSVYFVLLFRYHLKYKMKITLDSLQTILNISTKHFKRSIITQGEMVGTLAAQSLGEPVTQLTLNTFHSAGISAKNVTLGVPRFKELINISKNIKSPSMKLYFHNHTDLEQTASLLEYTTLSMLIDSYNIHDLDNHSFDWYFNFPDFIPPKSPFYIEFTFSPIKLRSRHINTLYLPYIFMDNFENIYSFISNNSIFIFFHTPITYEETHLAINKLQHFRLEGFREIKRSFIINDPPSIETDGSCLSDLLTIPNIDIYSCITNNICEIKDLLGIEAARNCLLKEIKHVLEFDGTYINNRHFLTLVDTMTYRGNLMAVTRHGINKSNAGPLMKCSFEETVDVLTDAAQFAECDYLKGVTENITLGKLSKLGTGSFDLFFQTNTKQYLSSFFF